MHLRASQINGLSASTCTPRRRAGRARARARVRRRRLARDALGDAERAALALTEELTRIADQAEPVPDAIWDAAAEHFDETQLGAPVLDIATVNLWNRLNIATRQVVGEQSW